jgi:pyrophosphatase PpaX
MTQSLVLSGSHRANAECTSPVPRFRFVIFDMDGTLVDTFTLILASYGYAVAGCLPKELNAPDVPSLSGYTLKDALAKSVPSDQIELASDRYHDYFARRFARRNRTYPGIRKLLVSLHQARVMLSVFTGASRRSAQIALQLSGLGLFFHSIVTADDVRRPKPDPEGLHKAMDLLAATDDQTIYVGDDPNDIVASRRAGINAAAALWGSRKRDQLETLRPDFLFNDPSDAYVLLAGSQ